jgi:long-subunit fatty acid transport protein
VGLFLGDYTDTMLNNTTPYGSGSLLNHEILTRKNTQYSVPAHITLAYELPLGDFRFRIGPTLGFTWVSIKSKFEGRNGISNPLDPSDPNSNGPQNCVSLTKSASEAVFSYGATAGVSWEITNRLRLDLQYRLISNGALDFGDMRNFGTSLSHQATIGLGWRF